MATKAQYANPFAHAKVVGERVDQGVDYAGTGTVSAIARGVVTEISPGGWGKYGNYLKYQITDKASPLYGEQVYIAEGVNPVAGLKVGSILSPGDPVANLIPGWHSGIETGLAGAGADSTYARESGGGYTEGHPTAAGDVFSLIVQALGGPGGKIEGPMQSGTSAPAGTATFLKQRPGVDWGLVAAEVGAGALTVGGAAAAGGAAADAAAADAAAGGGAGGGAGSAGSALSDLSKVPGLAKDLSVLGALDAFLSDPTRVLLTIVFVIGGALMLYEGAGRTLGFGSPVKSTAGRAAAVIA